ncbi:hypothetical protein LJC14_04635 [Treponema sp. OttesenSCG-928-L16]|nr:hypothetical protein [Treponema sp. OttesenSCG-928-L16]
MYDINFRVCTSHTDAEGKLKLVSAIDMMQDCSQMWMECEPVLGNYFRDNRIVQMLISRQADVRRLPVYGEKITARTTIFEIMGFQGFRNTVIYDGENKPCIVSWSTGAFVNLETGRLAKVPKEILDSVRMSGKIEMEYLGKKIALPALPGEELDPVPVKRRDIDFNRHMNNARYVEVSAEYLPEDFAVSRLRIEHKKAAKYGDSLYPRMIRGGADTIFILLSDGAGNPYTIMEFTGKSA